MLDFTSIYFFYHIIKKKLPLAVWSKDLLSSSDMFSLFHTLFSLFLNINHQIKQKNFWGWEIIRSIFNLCKLEKLNFMSKTKFFEKEILFFCFHFVKRVMKISWHYCIEFWGWDMDLFSFMKREKNPQIEDFSNTKLNHHHQQQSTTPRGLKEVKLMMLKNWWMRWGWWVICNIH